MKKKFTRSVSGALLAAALLVSSVPVIAAAPIFSDISGNHWCLPYAEKAFRDGAVGGTYYNDKTGERHFSPAVKLSYAQWLTMAVNAFWPDEAKNAQVDPNAEYAGTWYAKAVKVALDHELLARTEYNNLNDEISRYEMATVTRNIMEAKGIQMLSTEEATQVGFGIADWETIPFQYRMDVATVVKYGIIGGTDKKGTFSGDVVFDRAQSAVVYCKLDGLFNGGTTPDKPPVQPDKPVTPPAGACCPADYNADGKVTEAEVLQKLEELKVKYPDNSEYDNSKVYSPTFNGYAHDCSKLAVMISDDIFGQLTVRKANYGIEGVRPGDVIETTNHMEVATSRASVDPIAVELGFTGVYNVDVVSGGQAGVVDWIDESTFNTAPEANLNIVIWTRYPD